MGAPTRMARVRGAALRLYRLVLLVLVVLIVRWDAGRDRNAAGGIPLEAVRALMDDAAGLRADPDGSAGILDRSGFERGTALRTSPAADHITGYAGPTDTLIVLDENREIAGLAILRSADTESHLADIEAHPGFLRCLNGRTPEELGGLDPGELAGVSGATRTSRCVLESVALRLAGRDRPAGVRLHRADLLLALVLGGALCFHFLRFRRKAAWRRVFQVAVIVAVGFVQGDLLAQSLFGGWLRHGFPWRHSLGLLLVAAAALAIPWSTRRPFYCAQICPLGALQEFAGKPVRRKPRVPEWLDWGLRASPAFLLAIVLMALLIDLPVDLASVEGFDAFLPRSAGWVTLTIAGAGLLASLFVPMAYCRYGCPTGALLRFARSSGRERLRVSDGVATALVVFAFLLARFQDPLLRWIEGSARL